MGGRRSCGGASPWAACSLRPEEDGGGERWQSVEPVGCLQPDLEEDDGGERWQLGGMGWAGYGKGRTGGAGERKRPKSDEVKRCHAAVCDSVGTSMLHLVPSTSKSTVAPESRSLSTLAAASAYLRPSTSSES